MQSKLKNFQKDGQMEVEQQFSQEEGNLLLKLARNAIQSVFTKVVSVSGLQSVNSFPQKRGAFVSLWKDKELRGCLGIPNPSRSLGETIREMAVKSALEDPRYRPLVADEIPHVKIEICVLSLPKLIEPHQICLGVHGLIVHNEEGSGLLLPRDAVENRWDVATFLAATCLKGGLAPDAWKKEASIYAFETQIFREQ